MPDNSQKALIVFKVIGLVLFLYGLLAWLDGVVIQFTNPMWLAMPVSHLLNIRTDNFTIGSFIVSAIGLFIWRLTVELMRLEQKKSVQ